jgi:hypothetical protein
MIFDKLWRLESAENKENKRIRDFYHPKLEAAQKAKDEQEYQSLLFEMRFQYDLNEGVDVLRTEQLEKRARRLGIEIPPKPSRDADDFYNNKDWDYNQVTGTFTFTRKAEREIIKELRKEKTERLQYRMRLVSQVVVPLTGLLGTIIGVMSLLLRHK